MSSRVYIEKTIGELHSLLEDVLTGRSQFEEENDRYQSLRSRLSALSPLIGSLPEFLNASDSLWSLWGQYIKGKLPDYDSRRRFLAEEYKDYYNQRLAEIPPTSFEEEMILRDLVIEDTLGSGGFSIVYRAEHVVLDEPRAIKKLEPLFADEQSEINALRRFAREVRILSDLSHPNIVKVYDAGMSGTHPYIVMEYVEGSNLNESVTEKGLFSEDTAMKVMKQVLSAMSCAHGIGIVHRDIKPSNVMWDGRKATVLDFGAGQWLEQSISTRMTTAPIGTYGYIASELFEDPRLVHANLDCYSAGVLFHFLLSGRIPSTGDPRYYLGEHEVSQGIVDLILKSISPPETRYENGAAMLAALEGLT